MPFISVIIPVYKVERYLRQCVDSVLNQKLDDIEIILIDDGSPDNCPQICDEYAENYDCIKVIHKLNGGSSSARNAGIVASKGQYLMFMDSDDWWNPNVKAENLIAYIKSHKQTDMFLFSSLDYVKGKGYFKRAEHERLERVSTMSVSEYYRALLDNGNLEVAAYTKIVSAEFLKMNNLYFEPGILAEDNEWMMRILRHLHSVEIISEPLYVYRMNREGSITNKIGLKHITDLLYIVQKSIQYYQTHHEKDDYKDLELCFASYLWFSALGLSAFLSAEDRKKTKPLFLATDGVCKYSNSKKTILAYRLYKLTGLRASATTLGIYIRMKKKFNLNKTKLVVC